MTGEIVLATHPERVSDKIRQHIELGPNEGIIARLKPRAGQYPRRESATSRLVQPYPCASARYCF